MRTVRTECAHYRGDRPCAPHKDHAVLCDGCGYFEPAASSGAARPPGGVRGEPGLPEARHGLREPAAGASSPTMGSAGESILMVKLDAMGDVLRTTCVLEPAMRAWGRKGRPRLTWITRADSVPLLEGNPFVDRTVAFGPEAANLVETDRFDRVLCLDASRDAVALAARAAQLAGEDGLPAKQHGFTLRDGAVVPADERANVWWQMGLWDDLKKANQRSYQSHMMEMLGLPEAAGGYLLELTDAELELGRQTLRQAGLGPNEPFLALNVGGGGRWEYKRWTEPHMTDFVRAARQQFGMRVALFGGELELDLIGRLLRTAATDAFFPGVHPVRRFAAMLEHAQAVVTSDSLAMHLALARRRPTVILFGPTSVAEIETYGVGSKLAPDMDCLCCYLPRCDRRPYCQELIPPEAVLKSLKGLLERLTP